MSHIYNSTSLGSMIHIALQSAQMEAGSAHLLLTDPIPSLSYLSPCWLTSIRDFLRKHQLSLEFSTNWNFRLSRSHNQFLMDVFRNSNHFTPFDLRNLNAVRLFLQVATISDITSADGLTLHRQAYSGQKISSRASSYSWIRQLVITKSQQDLWKRALSLTLLSNSMPSEGVAGLRLRQPLGHWLAEPNQVWSYYYDPAQASLISPISPDLARVFPQVAMGRSRTHKCFDSHGIIMAHKLSPNSLVPADECLPSNYPDVIAASFDRTIRPGTIRSGESGQSEYIKSLPKYRKRLLTKCLIRQGRAPSQVIKIIQKAIDNNIPIEFGSDGSLSANGGSFGYVMSMAEVPLWEGAGPVDGDRSTASSTRSELFGYAGTLEFLILLHKVYNLCLSHSTVVTWIDSESALSRLRKLQSGRLYSRAYPDDADVISHIQGLWSILQGVTHTLKWVKAHQDDSCSFNDLQWSAKLNVIADSLATEYYNSTTHSGNRPNTNPLFFPSSKVSLLANGQRVTANISSAIRFHIQGTVHRAYLQSSKPNWSQHTVWNYIDHECIGLAYKSLPLQKRHQVSKLLHGWMNTGAQRKKFHRDSKSECPRCHVGPEDQDHLLQCNAPRARKLRYNESVTLRSSIVTKCGGSRTWTVLHSCLSGWMSNKHPATVINAKQYGLSVATATMINLALEEQKVIGWSQAARGYLSTKWLVAQNTEFPGSTVTGLRQHWMKHIVLSIWNLSEAMWAQQNEILHANSEVSRSIRESSIDAQTSLLHSQQADFAATDQVLFTVPLQIRLKHSHRSKKHWLSLVRRYKATSNLRQVGNQPSITKFFNRQPSVPSQQSVSVPNRGHSSRRPHQPG